MATTKTKAGKRERKPKKLPGARASAADKATAELARFRDANETLDATAAHWVSAIKYKLAEIFDEVDRVYAVTTRVYGPTGEATTTRAAVALASVIDADALRGIWRDLETLMNDVGDLLDPLSDRGIPDLAGACRDVAEAMGPSDDEQHNAT